MYRKYKIIYHIVPEEGPFRLDEAQHAIEKKMESFSDW